MPKAIVTGTAGQDGSFLSELLLRNGYEVYGVVRRASIPRLDNIEHLLDSENFHLVEGDITDPSSVNKLVQDVQSDEYYNLAAQSHVATSFEQPTTTFNINTIGVLNALEAIRHYSPKTRLYQASTSEQFGQNYKQVKIITPSKALNGRPTEDILKIQDESVPFAPRSPYGVSKLAAHELVKVYRESYGIFACCGILFNHESERRGHNFVTRKITRWLAKFCKDNELYIDTLDCDPKPELHETEKLRLGNLAAVRDWGYASDYVRAMYLILQQDQPDDYVIATGIGHTVADFLQAAFTYIHPKLDYKDYVVVDPKFYRPAEVDFLQGHAAKAKEKLGWKPTVDFNTLVKLMVCHDVDLLKDNVRG